MAGEWIKIEVATANKPEVMRIARILGIDKDAVFGKVMRLWAWFDTNSVDGVVDGIQSTDVDDVCYQVGFCNALLSVGWIQVDESTPRISLPKFDRHNGESAKKRCQKSEAQAKWRKSRSNVDQEASTKEPQKHLPEKRREEKINTPASGDAFESFWTTYPKKVAKPAAAKAFKSAKINGHLIQVLQDIENRKLTEDWKKSEGQFVPNPATYLNQRRWEDSQVTEKQNPFAGAI